MRTVLENAPQAKRPHGRPSVRWEDRIVEYVEKIKPGLGVNQKKASIDR